VNVSDWTSKILHRNYASVVEMDPVLTNIMMYMLLIKNKNLGLVDKLKSAMSVSTLLIPLFG